MTSEDSRVIAGVVIDTPLLHLDRVFDYVVPPGLQATISIGSQVRVRFARRLVSGWVVALGSHTEHGGRLAPIERVLGEGPVLTPATISACRAVAARWVGTFADVVRTAVPPRVAAVDRAEFSRSEASAPARATKVENEDLELPGWIDEELNLYPGLSVAADARDAVRAAVITLPGRDQMRILAALIARRCSVGGVLAVLPDSGDVQALAEVLDSLGVHHVCLTSHMRRDARWRAFRRLLAGDSHVAIGTRGAAFAPVDDVKTFIIWDDGAQTHEEPHAPYWHAREVLAMRAQAESAAFFAVGVTMTAESAALERRRWLTVVTASPAQVRACAPRVSAAAVRGDSARHLATATGVPDAVFAALRSGLQEGPVLVLVPRRGYVPAVLCAGCRAPRMCVQCGAAIHISPEGPACSACSTVPPRECATCGASGWRASAIGQDRLVEQFGKAFARVRIVSSNADKPVRMVPNKPALVIATSGCEPIAQSGYAAIAALDIERWLSLPDVRAEQFAFTRLAHAFSLARPQAPAVIAGDAGTAVAQALIRWDPVGFAKRQLQERQSAHLPPAARAISLQGSARDVLEVIDELSLPEPSQIIGPVAEPNGLARVHIGVPWRHGADMSHQLRNVLAQRQAAHRGDPVRVHVDPAQLG